MLKEGTKVDMLSLNSLSSERLKILLKSKKLSLFCYYSNVFYTNFAVSKLGLVP